MALTHFSCAAFDLDGTLLDGHSQLSPRTKVALDDLHRAGVQVIVCSGRPFSTIPKDILAHPAVRFVATGNGVRIFDKALGKDVYCCALAQQTLEDILELVQYYPVGYEFFIQGKAFANRAYLADPALYGADLMSNRYLTTTRAPFDDVRSFITAHRNTIDSMGLSLADMVLKKQLWQQTIKMKISNQAAALATCTGKNSPTMLRWADDVRSGDPDNVEGRAAAYYWKNLFAGIDGLEDFTRSREGEAPNNLLNYGYAILRAIVARALVSSGMLPTLGIHHHNRYNAYCLADDIMEPYRPYVDELVYSIVKDKGINNLDLSKDIKALLLSIPTLDVVIGGKRSPLMVAVTQTTASLYKCFTGELRRIAYPVR